MGQESWAVDSPLVLPGPEAGTEWAQAWFHVGIRHSGKGFPLLLSKSGEVQRPGLEERIPSVGPLEGVVSASLLTLAV